MSTIPLQFVRTIAFISGFCALVYQIAWMRHLRLIFGASTGASAAVLAIFMGGLGVGALWIGRKADQAARPLEFYGNLELGVAGTAAVSPVLVDLARSVYFGIGGSQALGSVGAVCVQLVLSSVVLAAPCILMGATLPTLARTVERSEDQGRGELGIIYGVNTLGAVLGCAVTTFFLLEVLGVRNSLWTAAALNTFIGLAARSRARQLPVTPGLEEEPTTAEATTAEPTADAVAPVGFVYSAAAVVGLAFFSMELVWYRMFAPLLGGSSYSFGLILTVALLGIGGGAAVYGRRGTTRRPTLFAFAVTCALEAAFVAIPYGVGDSLAALTLVLRDLQVFGFSGLVVGWACVTMLVVLPPALISGYQFPLLVGLLGSGRDRVAAQVGTTYMWNTVGAIVGSIVSGFGLLIALGATQLWIVMVVVLMFIAAVALAIGLARGEPARGARPVFAGALLVSVLSVTSEGPTSAWRHSPIGAGRVSANVLATQNSFESFRREFSSNVYWEADGRESSVALLHGHGFNFAVSGKVDGHTVGDLPTTVLSGLLGALMHPNPRLAFVIGLGVGSTAGWLGKVPTMERVDVVEFEPAIVGVAKESGPVNEDMFNNPKVRLLFGDGREVLMTSQDQYDIVFSEPSNPYRAGIASLYSQDFYKSAFSKMTERGVFVQFIQAYEIDPLTLKTALATMGSVFPIVEIWSTHFGGDLLLVAFKSEEPYVLEAIATRAGQSPFREGLEVSWGVSGVGGVFAGFVMGAKATRTIAEEFVDFIDTDDNPVLDFGFARTVGHRGLGISRDDMIKYADEHEGRTPNTDAPVSTLAIADAIDARVLFKGEQIGNTRQGVAPNTEEATRMRARAAYANRDFAAALELWSSQPSPPVHIGDVQWMAMAMARLRQPEDPALAERLGRVFPTQLELTRAVRLNDPRNADALTRQLIAVFESARNHPLYDEAGMIEILELTKAVVRQDPSRAQALLRALEAPFSLHRFQSHRMMLILSLSGFTTGTEWCLKVFNELEPYVPWEEGVLATRVRCYDQAGDPRATYARAEYEEFLSQAVNPF